MKNGENDRRRVIDKRRQNQRLQAASGRRVRCVTSNGERKRDERSGRTLASENDRKEKRLCVQRTAPLIKSIHETVNQTSTQAPQLNK
ncbi:hypothetical protein NDU88_001404 [Pleurodeles waltl]|uniref:Uncharacterized protein n=1 Tax=Pleurodeles waltl TaxID=8319 RepID=A0AAV7NEN3_PLEWA|nr:hypothetical protein NDU88_001404 [Pleurodeles waltl]